MSKHQFKLAIQPKNGSIPVWKLTQAEMADALMAGAEPAATIPGEPFEFFGADEKLEHAKAAIFDNGEERYYIIKEDGLYVKNPTTLEPLFDTVDEAWKEYHRQAIEQAITEGKNVPTIVLAEQSKMSVDETLCFFRN